MNGDGRNIDESLGILSAEASIQATPRDPAPSPAQKQSDDTYYDRPILKKSPWSWDIPAYYYVGGATGGLMTLSTAATLLNRNALASLITRSRYLATAGATISAVLLIHDLGRPSRFLNMLRVFRPTSPMSVGTWILVTFSTATGLSAVTQTRYPRLSDIFSLPAGILGLALSGYTGVLIANTAVPIWHQPHRLMPILFLASGAASAASILDLFGATEQEHRAAKTFGLTGKAIELTTAILMEREVAKVPEVAKPLHEGSSAVLWQAGKLLTAASLVLSLIPAKSRNLRRAAGILGTAGSLCIRFGIHYAGQKSADNPRATFHQQRRSVD